MKNTQPSLGQGLNLGLALQTIRNAVLLIDALLTQLSPEPQPGETGVANPIRRRKRKQRSDKGQPRGKRESRKQHVAERIARVAAEIKRKRGRPAKAK